MRFQHAWRALACGLVLTAWAPASLAQEEEDSQRAFSIPERTEALRRAREVESHLSARRWPQAIQTLQDLIERDGDAVLPESYRQSAEDKSIHSAFPGAGEWASRRLLSLPQDAVEVYRQRFDASAKDALKEAIRRLDKHALAATANRWPLCDSASRALWILGELELEAGHRDQALIAWRQAIDAIRATQPEVDGEPNPRLAVLEERCRWITERLLEKRVAQGMPQPTPARESLEQDPLKRGDLSQLRTPLPSRDAASWYTFIDMWPFALPGSSKVLYPTEHRGRVLVSNSLKLFCFDAYTGREIWRSEAPTGWETLSEREKNGLIAGVYPEMLQVKPVASGRVALAVLQMPYSSLPNRYYRDMTVMRAIPQRRLFAFDLETGAPLWDHGPDLIAGEGDAPFTPESIDSYAEGMMIAAPPTVVGTRVLVPSYILEGRIDYQVACYALESGELLWKTNLISGQRSRNMFGRAMREFCSSQLVVEGERVIAQTDLGSLAALDLNTGKILWESLYRQIEQRVNYGFNPRGPRITWLTSEPVIIDGKIISTPADSEELYCFNLKDGRVIWSYSQSFLSKRSRNPFNVLLGADAHTVYLGGSQVAALRKPGGIGSLESFQTTWDRELPSARNWPPQLLCKDGILIPSTEGRMVLTRSKGAEMKNLSAPWDSAGTPIVQDGILLTLGRDGLRGYFDWQTLLDKQNKEYKLNPNNYEVALASAQLFARRAEAGLLDGELFVSLSNLRKARDILEAMDGEQALETRTGALLHQVLRTEASALVRKGDRGPALERLRTARKLAPHPRALRDTLLQEERLLIQFNSGPAYLAILDELELRCAAQPLPRSFLSEPSSSLELDEDYLGRMPSIGLWVLLQRAEANSRAGKLQAAFEDWSRAMESYGDFELRGQTAYGLAARRIGEELKRPAGHQAYASFEVQAQALLEAASVSKDLAALDRLTRAFPHSQAATRSDQIQIDWAYDQANPQRLASIVHGPRATELPDAGRDAFLRLGRLLGAAGNQAYERGLLQKLIKRDPNASSSLPGQEGQPLVEILDDLLAQVPAQFEPMPRFGSDLQGRRIAGGRHSFLGSLGAASGSAKTDVELHVYAQQPESSKEAPVPGLSRPTELGIKNPIHVIAYSSDEPQRQEWHSIVVDEFHNPNGAQEASITSSNRVVVGGRLGVHALDAEGQPVWEHPPREQQLEAKFLTRSLSVQDGIVVAWMQVRDDSSVFLVRAFDLALGTVLWEVPLQQEDRRWFAPILGPEHVVFLSKPYRRPVIAHVIDLFSGRTVAEYELGEIIGPVERITWVQDEFLMVPHFGLTSGQTERIAVHDLLSGRELWSQALPGGEELRNIVHHGGRSFVVMFTSQPGHSGGVYEFKHKARSLRRILPLRVGERPLGIGDRELVLLQSPELLLYTNDSTLGLRVRALDLEQGRSIWSRPLPIEAKQTFLPVTSENYVAIAASSKLSSRKKLASLFLLDRKTGAQSLRIELDANLSQASQLTIQGLGESIYIAGTGSLSRGHLLEILHTKESSR